MLLAKLLIAGTLSMPVVGYPDLGQPLHLSPRGKTVALSIAEETLAKCIAGNVAENTTMSYTDAIVDAMRHSCRAQLGTAANVIEHHFDDVAGNNAFDRMLDELPYKVEEYLGDSSKEPPGL